jgi:hypothetical protein
MDGEGEKRIESIDPTTSSTTLETKTHPDSHKTHSLTTNTTTQQQTQTRNKRREGERMNNKWNKKTCPMHRDTLFLSNFEVEHAQSTVSGSHTEQTTGEKMGGETHDTRVE